jgi:hypothetical protein
MDEETLKQMFIEWFADSYPNAKPATHSVMSHVAFAQYVIESLDKEMFEEIEFEA